MSAFEHRTDLLPFAPGDAPGFAVTHLTQAHWSVRIWGTLGPFWADAFSLGLADAGISILRGFARQDGAGRWIADFVLSPGTASPAPSSLDFLFLASRPPAVRDGGPIVLSHYALDGGPDVGPSLYLEVRGPDRLGFLGSLLHALAGLDLSPREGVSWRRDSMPPCSRRRRCPCPQARPPWPDGGASPPRPRAGPLGLLQPRLLTRKLLPPALESPARFLQRCMESKFQVRRIIARRNV